MDGQIYELEFDSDRTSMLQPSRRSEAHATECPPMTENVAVLVKIQCVAGCIFLLTGQAQRCSGNVR